MFNPTSHPWVDGETLGEHLRTRGVSRRDFLEFCGSMCAVMATGIASITVAFTGFCVVGNILKRFGFTPMLGAKTDRGGWYFMQTDRWYLERRIYLAVGININIASVLSLAHSPWWLAFTGFVGVAMVWFAVTGYCIMANGLYWLGAEPRLAPERPSDCPVPDEGHPARV